MGHTLRFFETVDEPYERVVEQLRKDALGLFQRASKNAAARDEGDGVELHAKLGTVAVAADVAMDVGEPQQAMSSPLGYPMTTFPLAWRAREHSAMFPQMQAKLVVYPHSDSRTQLELEGDYDPPLGVLGDALDALGGHHLAESSAGHFLREVAVQLRMELIRASRAPRAALE